MMDVASNASVVARDSAAAEEMDLQHHLRRLDRLANLGLLAAGVAHEIKNGLVAISTFTELLLEKNEDRKMAETVRAELQRINLLVTQILRFAAPKPAELKSVAIQDLLEHSLRLLQYQMSDKMISVQRDYPAQPVVARGDEFQLQQIFMNLLFNAIDAMGAKGVMTLTTKIVDDMVKISIADTGVGIAPENLARLFEPFFTTKKNCKGLGLTISQRIAEEHGGSISAKSELGKGSVFILTLPAA
jgi:signal transduction histidine kinase